MALSWKWLPVTAARTVTESHRIPYYLVQGLAPMNERVIHQYLQENAN